MLKLGLALLVIPSVLIMVPYMMEQNQVQACIAAGQVWDYGRAECLEEGDPTFVPFLVRYPLLVNGTLLLSVIGLLMTIFGLYRPSKPRAEHD